MILNNKIVSRNLTPFFYRTASINATVDAYVLPCFEDINAYDTNREAIRNQTIYSAEKILLENFCNDVYDDTLRRIFIAANVDFNIIFLGEDAEGFDVFYYGGVDPQAFNPALGQDPETFDIFLGFESENDYFTNLFYSGEGFQSLIPDEDPAEDIFMFDDGEGGTASADIIVNVPTDLSGQNDIIKQTVDLYLRSPFVSTIVNF